MILFFFSDFKVGGSQKIAIDIVNKISKSNKNTTILTLSSTGGLKSLIKKDVIIYNLKSERLSKSFFLCLNFFKKKNFLKVFCVHPHLAILCYVLNFFLHKKLNIFARETNTSTFNKYRKKNLRNLFEILIKKFFYKKLSGVFFSSKNLASEYNCKKFIIPNFADMEKVNILKKKKISENILRNNNKFILGIGRLIEQKRFSDLIRSFNIISKKIPHNLLIIGEGPEKKKLDNLIKYFKLDGRVKIIPFTNNPYMYLNKCDVFVLTSAWEGMPNILIQALFCGSKIVSTDCKHGPREILSNGKYGDLIQVGDYQKIALSIMKNVKKRGKTAIHINHLRKYSSEYLIPKYAKVLTNN
tara:strand:- start:469 stop:1536 length:1068 start_codon:yes stop_codon:yes gene_type:complete